MKRVLLSLVVGLMLSGSIVSAEGNPTTILLKDGYELTTVSDDLGVDLGIIELLDADGYLSKGSILELRGDELLIITGDAKTYKYDVRLGKFKDDEVDAKDEVLGQITKHSLIAKQNKQEDSETSEELKELESKYNEIVQLEQDYIRSINGAITNTNNAGLQPHVAVYKEFVGNMFGITSFSLYRPGDPGDHGKGLAVDFMVPVSSELGDRIAQYAISTMDHYGVSYVIWKQHIYGDWNRRWVPMEDRGSITENHYDHVHVSFH